MTGKYTLATGGIDSQKPTKKIGEANWFIIEGSVPELAPIVVRDRMKAISHFLAFSDVHKMGGKYLNAKLSSPGVHVFAGTDLKAEYADRVGVVHQTVGPDELFPQPDPEDCYRGWANVDIDTSLFFPTAPEDLRTWKERKDPQKLDTRISMARKHSAIDKILKGYTINIWVAPLRRYLAKVMETWKIKNVKARWDKRNNAILSRNLHNRDFKEAAKDDYVRRTHTGNGRDVDPETGEVLDTTPEVALMVSVLKSGRARALKGLPAGAYQVHTKTGQSLGFTVDWDPQSPMDNFGQWQVLVTNGYKIALH